MVKIVSVAINCPEYTNDLKEDLRYISETTKQIGDDIITIEKKKIKEEKK